VKKQES